MDAEYIYINASSENSIDVIRNQISEFAQTMSFTGSKKIVILDEADGLTPQFQKALRAFMEEFQSNCRFILTCNYIAKIIPALRQGRTMEFDFNMAKFKDELVPKITTRIEGILKFEKIEYDKEILPKVVTAFFPSVRQVIATLQQYAETHGKIDAGILTHKDVGDTFIEQQGMYYTDVFHTLFETFVPKCTKKANAITTLAEYEYRCGFSTDPTLQIAACIIELFACI